MMAPGIRARVGTWLALGALAVPGLGAQSWAGPTAPTLTAELEWTWSLFGAEIGSRGTFTTDLDGDGDLEIVTMTPAPGFLGGAGDVWYVASYDGVLRQAWSSLPYSERIVRLRPLAEAGGADIALVTTSSLETFDGATRQLVRAEPGVGEALRDFWVADLGGDGGRELVLCDGGDLEVLDFDTLTPVGAAAGLECNGLDVAQADGDSALEILVTGYGVGYVLDGISLLAEWTEPLGFETFSRFLDLDDDGVAEVVCDDPAGGGLRALSLPAGQPLWASTAPTWGVAAIAPRLLTTPAGARLLVGDSGSPEGLTALDAATGVEVWRAPFVDREFFGLDLGDFDADGVPEAVFGTGELLGETGHRLVVIDLEARIVEHESFDFDAPLVGLTVADIDRDTRPDLVTASYSSRLYEGGRLLILDPAQRMLAWADTRPEWFPAYVEASLAAQLDSDRALELCLAGGDSVRCEDGITHAEHWTVYFHPDHGTTALAAADVDGDRRDEVLVGTWGGFVYALDRETGWLVWRSPQIASFSAVAELTTVELDGTPGAELLVRGAFSGGSTIAVLDLASGAIEQGPHVLWTIGSATAVELDGDAADEIVVGNDLGELARLDPETGTTDPPWTAWGVPVKALTAADLDGDGAEDLLAWAGERVRVFSVALPDELWQSPHLGAPGNSPPLWAGNADLDLDWEIVTLTRSGVALFELPFPGPFADGFESGDASAWSFVLP